MNREEKNKDMLRAVKNMPRLGEKLERIERNRYSMDIGELEKSEGISRGRLDYAVRVMRKQFVRDAMRVGIDPQTAEKYIKNYEMGVL
jgi:hypothetical protein